MEEDTIKKHIRFIDSEYNTLFFVDDGGEIEIQIDGIWQKRTCRYISECHTNIGGYDYHIREFAEKMQALNQPYRPVFETAGYPVMVRELIDAFVDPERHTKTRKEMKDDYEAARNGLRRKLMYNGCAFTIDGLDNFLDGYFYALTLFEKKEE